MDFNKAWRNLLMITLMLIMAATSFSLFAAQEQSDDQESAEVGKYRNSVATDVDALRAQVTQRIADGETGIVLTYPSYSPWSWTTQTEADDEP